MMLLTDLMFAISNGVLDVYLAFVAMITGSLLGLVIYALAMIWRP